MSETNKTLKRKRMISYFIDAAAELMGQEGSEGITVRTVADRAGYNAATLYNYFENFDHLIYLAALKLITPYTANVGAYIRDSRNSLEMNLKCWEFFFKHSFQNPGIYEKIFFSQFDSEALESYTQDYYSLFYVEDPETPASIREMLFHQDFFVRTRTILYDCITEGFFRKQDLEDIVEMSIFLYKGLLSQLLDGVNEPDPEALMKKGMTYLRRCYNSFLSQEHQLKIR